VLNMGATDHNLTTPPEKSTGASVLFRLFCIGAVRNKENEVREVGVSRSFPPANFRIAVVHRDAR